MPDDFFAVKPVKVRDELAAETPPSLLDVREVDEFDVGHIAGATNIPLRQLAKQLNTLPANSTAPIVVYCRTGQRGAIALTVLRMIGYTNVRNIAGGLDGWTSAGLEVTK